MSEQPEIRVYPARRKLLAFLAMSAVFALAGLWLSGIAGAHVPRYGVVDAVIGYAALVFFGFGTFYFAFRLVVRRPSLVIDDERIVDNASALSAGPVPWEEVTDVSAASFRSQRFLVVEVRDEAALLARQNPLKASLMRVNRWMGGALVWIPMHAVPMPEEQVLAEIGRRRVAR